VALTAEYERNRNSDSASFRNRSADIAQMVKRFDRHGKLVTSQMRE
jgi:hypothetical protein